MSLIRELTGGKNFLQPTVELSMEMVRSMEWKIFGMEWNGRFPVRNGNGMEDLDCMEYGKISFHSIPCHALVADNKKPSLTAGRNITIQLILSQSNIPSPPTNKLQQIAEFGLSITSTKLDFTNFDAFSLQL